MTTEKELAHATMQARQPSCMQLILRILSSFPLQFITHVVVYPDYPSRKETPLTY